VAMAEYKTTKSRAIADRLGTRLETADDADPWKASDALGVTNVPTLFRVGGDGVIAETVVGFDRERFRGLALRAAALVGKPPTELFLPSDNAPPIKPG